MRSLLRVLFSFALLAAATAATGCVVPAARGVVVVHDRRPARAFVVVLQRPARHRHCWRHAGHWHCRR